MLFLNHVFIRASLMTYFTTPFNFPLVDKNNTMTSSESFCLVDVNNVHLKLHVGLCWNNHIKASTSFKQISNFNQ